MPEPVSEILFVVREGDDGGLIAEAACHVEEGQRPRAIRLHYVHDECA